MSPDGKQAPAAAEPYEIYNPILPGTIADPYPAYEQLRREAPVWLSPRLNMWLLSHYSDVSAVLRDPRFLGGPARSASMFRFYDEAQKESLRTLRESFQRWALFQDPPDHTRVRTLITRAFTPSMVERMRPKVEAITAELLDEAEKRHEFDIIADLAYPLPVIVIAEMLGLPASDRNLVKGWSDDIAAFMARLVRPYDIALKAQDSIRRMGEYLREALRERRARPAEDLLTMLSRAEAPGGKLTEDEIIATSAMLLFAGHETTTNLIGNGMLGFLRHPDQWDLIGARPDLAGNAVEEALRYDSPVQFVGRVPQEDVELQGRKITAGSTTLCLLGSANRDHQQFADADAFRIGRHNAPRHLSFGQGIHYCVGAPLSRIEGVAAFTQMVKRYPRLALAELELRYREELGFRGVKSLKVKVV